MPNVVTPFGRAVRAPGKNGCYGDVVLIQNADQNLTNQTTLQNATDLQFSLLANKTYKFRAFLMFNEAGTTAGVRLGATGPASPTLVQIGAIVETTTGAIALNTANSFTTIILAAIASTGLKFATMEGTIINGANAGLFAVSWAQTTADAVNATTLKAGSTLTITQLT